MPKKTKASHPGEILLDEITARDMSAHGFAMALGVPATRISEILKCRRGVTPETALRLARYLGGSPRCGSRSRPTGTLPRPKGCTAKPSAAGSSRRRDALPRQGSRGILLPTIFLGRRTGCARGRFRAAGAIFFDGDGD